MATATDYRLDGMPRVRVLCALTGGLIYEPTHPWLEQVRLHLLKKWTWINRGTYLPAALTLFYLHFEVEQQPMDDFQCLGDLMLRRPLDIQCFVRVPQRPDIRSVAIWLKLYRLKHLCIASSIWGEWKSVCDFSLCGGFLLCYWCSVVDQ